MWAWVIPCGYKTVDKTEGGSVAEWLACWTQAQKDCCRVTVLGKTVHTHCAAVHQAAKLVAALLRVARVTAGLAESNGSLPPGLWLTSPAGWLPRTRISCGTCSVIEYGLPLPFFTARCYASAVQAMALCPSVCLSVRPSVRHKSVFY